MGQAEADDQGGAGWPTQRWPLQNIQRRAVSGGRGSSILPRSRIASGRFGWIGRFRRSWPFGLDRFGREGRASPGVLDRLRAVAAAIRRAMQS